MDSVNREAIEGYYNLLEDTLKEHSLLNTPAQIYSMDESGMPLDPRTPNVIAKRGQKKVRYRVSGKKEQITVLGCANALGQAVPPMVILEGIYSGLLERYQVCHWSGRPLLLLLDGHSSHYEPASVELAREEGIILFCLPPHTTQDSQPLNCTVFGPLKRHWSDVCHKFQQSHPGMVISKLNFSGLFAEAWLKALTPANIVAGFRKCGVYPFNGNAIPLPADGSSEPSNPPNSDSVEPHTSTPPTATFTAQQLELFETRFEEGYNIYDDQDYVAWLDLNHPESLPSDEHTLSSQSLLDYFNDVSPPSPVLLPDPTVSLSRTSPPPIISPSGGVTSSPTGTFHKSPASTQTVISPSAQPPTVSPSRTSAQSLSVSPSGISAQHPTVSPSGSVTSTPSLPAHMTSVQLSIWATPTYIVAALLHRGTTALLADAHTLNIVF